MTRARQFFVVFAVAVVLALVAAAPAEADGGPNDPPDWCFKTNANGELPTCTYDGSGWHRSYESSASGGGGGGGIAMTLLSDDGFEATYLASNLRTRPAPEAPAAPTPAAASAAVRLRELRELLDEGLITQAEHDERRRAVLEAM